MSAKEIRTLKSQGFTEDQVYELAACESHLFTIAFFGHRGTTKQKQYLNTIWNRILNIYSL